MQSNPDIVQVIEKYRSTVALLDLDGHLDLYSDDTLVFDAWDDWSFQGIGPLRQMVKAWFDGLCEDRLKVEVEDLRTGSSGDCGYASAVLKYVAYSKDGSPLRWLQNRFTWVLERRGTDWKIVHQHSSAPAHHETLKIELRRPGARLP